MVLFLSQGFLLMSFSRMVSMVLFLRGVDPILDNGYGI